MVDATGAPIPGVFVFLQSESDAIRRSRGLTDNDGAFKFLDLPAGNFRLEVISTTFSNKSIRVVNLPAEEARVLAPIELQVGLFSGCDSHLLHLQDGSILASTADTGDLAGAFVNKKDKPIANVVVELSCKGGQICGLARTNANGEFLFRGLKPGYYSVIAKGARHYSLTKEGFVARAGLRLT
ncbi:MAG: carboxypeptidase-like regulatory domain-containing protein [Paludibaculum sp.]